MTTYRTIKTEPRVVRGPDGPTIVYEEPPATPDKAVERSVRDAHGRAAEMVANLRKRKMNPDPLSVLEMAMTAVFQLNERVKKLEQGSKSLADFYRGPHLKNCEYHRSELVTFDGSLWMALADTKESPGQSADWKLVVKGAR